MIPSARRGQLIVALGRDRVHHTLPQLFHPGSDADQIGESLPKQQKEEEKKYPHCRCDAHAPQPDMQRRGHHAVQPDLIPLQVDVDTDCPMA